MKEEKDCNCSKDGSNNSCGCENKENEVADEVNEEKMKIELEDGSVLECFVIGVFGVEDKEYIALLPEEEETVYLYEYKEVEEEIELLNIESDEEFSMVSEAFDTLFGDEEE